MPKPYFSVIIPTLNEEMLLPRLLASLKKQRFKDFEVIIADNHSTDKTPEIIREYGAKIVEGGSRPGVGRNRGASVAKGEYLAFLDADTVLDFDFLEKLRDEILKRNFSGASGFFVGDKGSAFDRFTHAILNYYFWSIQRLDPHACGFYFIIKRDVFEKLHGFDENIYMAEDHELAHRIRDVGKFVFLKKPTITVSTRRVGREGLPVTIAKGLYVEIYRVFNKKITKKLFNYEMGGVDEVRKR